MTEPRNLRPSREPIDLEAVSRIREQIESAPIHAMEHAVDSRHYADMAGTRENSHLVEPRILDRDEARSMQEVLPSAAFLDEMTPDEAAAGELLGVMRSRRSCRSFDGRPIPQHHIDLILEAGRWAPSAGNAQPWEFILVTQEDGKRKLAEILAGQIRLMKDLDPTFPGLSNPRYLLSTPLIVMPYGDIRATAAYPYPIPREVRRNFFEQSIAMCIQNMWLMATRLGLGATNYSMGFPQADVEIRKAFDIPEHFVMPTMLLLGYPRHAPMPRPRRPLKEMIHHERFDPARVRSDSELIDFFYEFGVRGRGFR